MKKFQLLVALCLATIICLMPMDAGYKKVTLVERFTSTGCGPCNSYNKQGYTAFVNAYAGKIAVITYHVPIGPDPFYLFNTALSDGRSAYYKISGVPFVVLNGAPAGTPSATTLKQYTDNDLATESPMKITATFAVEKNNDAKVNVKIVSDEAMTNVILRVFIIEKTVDYNAPNGETEFTNIARYSLTDDAAAGKVFSINANASQSFSYTQKIDASKLNKDSLYVVAFVQNPSKNHRVEQAAISTKGVEGTYPKISLVERFTNTSCGPCAYYNSTGGYTEFAKSYSNKIATVTYHTSWPGPDDPFYQFNKALSTARVDYYNALGAAEKIEGVPHVSLNGTKVGNGMPKVSDLKQLVDEDLANKSVMLVTPKMTISNNNEVKVVVNIKSDQALKDVILRVLLLEGSVSYPAPNGETEFLYIARYSLTDTAIKGEKFSIAAKGEQNFAFTKKVDVEKLNKDQLYAIAFVQNQGASYEVIQAGITHKFSTENIAVEIKRGSSFADKKVALNTPVAHSFEITNKSNFKVTATLDSINGYDWNYSAKPANTIALEPNEKKIVNYAVTYTGTKPSAGLSGYTLNFKRDGTAEPNVIYPTKRNLVAYVDVTNNTQYAYITSGLLANDYGGSSLEAFKKANYFNDELVFIPAYDESLFTSKILDDMKFVGLSVDESAIDAFVQFGKSIFPKITSIANNGGKIYLSAPAQFAIAGMTESTNPTAAQYIVDFYKTQFGVSNENKNYFELVKDGQLYILPIKGANDSIAKGKTDTLNIEYSQTSPLYVAYSDIYDIDDATTSAVYGEASSNKTVMIKRINNNKNESVLSGFDLQGMKASRRIELANNIVDWLFSTVSIRDGETNMSSKNGLKLATTPNPVVNSANIVVNNENSNDTYTNLYLIDLNGKKVYTVFSGMLQTGENHFNLLSNNLTVGKYFLVAETNAGKTFMSVIIDK